MPQGLLRKLWEIIACLVLAWSIFFPAQERKKKNRPAF